MPPVRALCGPRGTAGRHSEIIPYLSARLSMCLFSCQSAWLLGSQYVWMLLCLFSLSTYIPCLAACLPTGPTCLPVSPPDGPPARPTGSLPPCPSVCLCAYLCLSAPLHVWWSSFKPPLGRAFIHHGQAKIDSIWKRFREENSLKLMGNCTYRMIKNTFCEWRYLSLLDREWRVL